MRLAVIPAGTFHMGSPGKEQGRFADEGPRHKVILTRPFFLGVFQVTQAQWRQVIGTNPSNFPGEDHPVERVAWEEAREFCRSLSAKEKRVYRLPSEAEWEFACRAGTTTPFYFGEILTDRLANYDANVTYAHSPRGTYRQHTLPVGSFPPNAFGLFDMHGNVREWCEDRFGSYARGPATDPQGPQTGADRVARGGAWYNVPGYCRSAFRRSHSPDTRDSQVGFRVCREYG
jgi:formylglycine-generating enzyme required for sulfatase activity